MRRRRFIAALSGAAAVWPLAARAQQPAAPVIGLLHPVTYDAFSPNVAAFRLGLREGGYIEGKNVTIEYRWADGRFDRLPELAADLVSRRVSVIATPGNTTAALAASSATRTIPIVFGIPDDPVKFGLAASLARPGGNATGVIFFTTELVRKRLELLHELVPSAARVAVLVNPANATNAESTVQHVKAAARAIGLRVQIVNASSGGEIDTAFAALMRERPDALFVGPDAFFNSRRVQLASLAARYALPASYSVRDYVEAGGLMSYGTSIPEMFRQVGAYVARILDGAKPADLPVSRMTRFELVINMKTARALGIAIAPSLLASADEVIE